MIGCNLEPNFTAVYWFEGTDDNEPLIRFDGGVKSGRGYTSAEFDISSNGSLVIKRANFANDMMFKAIILYSAFQAFSLQTKVSVFGRYIFHQNHFKHFLDSPTI